MSSSLPRDAATPFVAPFTMSPDWRDGLDYFLTTESPMGSVTRLRKQQDDLRSVSVLAQFFPPKVLRHDGLPTWTPTTEEERDAYDVAQIAQMNAETWGRFLAEGLMRFAEEYGPPPTADVAAEVVRRWGCDPHLARVLATGLDHYWRGDYEACVHVVVPRIETAIRGLLRELNEAVFQEQVGRDPGGFPGMYGMLRSLADLGFDEDWTYFLKTLLLDPPGLNIRNNLAHGSLPDVGPVYAALVLRAVALVVTLTPPQPGGLGGETPRSPSLVTLAEHAATRAELLAKIGAPIAKPVRFPESPASVELKLPRWVIPAMQLVHRVRTAWAHLRRRG